MMMTQGRRIGLMLFLAGLPAAFAVKLAGGDDGKPKGVLGLMVRTVHEGSSLERALAERMKGKPFALLGVNCDDDRQAAISAIRSERMTWPNWHDGAPGEGPIAKRYHIRGYPSVFVIDAQGIIRQHTPTLGDVLEKAIDDLVEKTQSDGRVG
jgi:hypothetical protein